MSETIKILISVVAIVLSCFSLYISFRTNRHKDNFEIAKEKYFKLLVHDIPASFDVFENEPGGNLKGESAIQFLTDIDTLRNEINLLSIIDHKRYDKIIMKIDDITEDIGKLSRNRFNTSFQQTKEWERIKKNLKYIVRRLLLTI